MFMRIATAVFVAAFSLSPLPAHAALLEPTDSASLLNDTPGDFLEARQLNVANARVAGRVSSRQKVTAWSVSHGTWQGQTLDGLTLVLVQTSSEDGRQPSTTNCYISHLATPAQRRAMLNAYTTTQQNPQLPLNPENIWRVEPAVIRLEQFGSTVILHVGTIA